LRRLHLTNVNKYQKADAIRLAHLKTFTAEPLLIPYYVQVEKNFKTEFEALAKKYSPFDDSKRTSLKKEIQSVNLVIGKLDKKYADMLRNSLDGYAKHVKKAAHSVFQDFIFPLPIPGLTY
jgi:hypothetical protein